MALVPAGDPGKILQWYDAGGGVYQLRNRSMDDLLDEIASTGPTSAKYYLDVTGIALAASASSVLGVGAVGDVAVSGASATSASAVSGTGTVGEVTVSTGASAAATASAVSGTGEIAGVTVTGGAVGSAAAVSGAGSVGAVSVQAGGGATALVPANPSFETDFTATTEQTAGWWKTLVSDYYEDPPVYGNERYSGWASAGTYSRRVWCTSVGEYGSASTYNGLAYKFLKADVDAAQQLTFDLRLLAGSSIDLEVYPRDAGGAYLLATTHQAYIGITYNNPASGADNTTLRIASPQIGVTYSPTLDLKAWVEARLASGKTWSDVSKIVCTFRVYGVGDVALDNFR